MNTAETSGKGKLGIFASGNALLVKNSDNAGYSFTYTTYGLNSRIDLYAGAAATTIKRKTQIYASGGANVNIIKNKVVSVSDYFIFSTPITNRAQGTGLIIFHAIIVSHNFKRITAYSGYSVTAAVGDKENKIFTPPSAVNNVPIGFAISKGKFAYYLEYGFGKAVKTAGVGASITF
jgi:hypothetical protein